MTFKTTPILHLIKLPLNVWLCLGLLWMAYLGVYVHSNTSKCFLLYMKAAVHCRYNQVSSKILSQYLRFTVTLIFTHHLTGRTKMKQILSWVAQRSSLFYVVCWGCGTVTDKQTFKIYRRKHKSCNTFFFLQRRHPYCHYKIISWAFSVV